ncbi:MAG: HNH endonuclease domain-containing protein [Cyclobacteriaceae bacterium]
MTKTLGLDLGTNSIGWAVIDQKSATRILNKGVHIFSEGVKIEKGVESSKAAERTAYRSARKIKSRRRIRKQQTLLLLAQRDMCPLTPQEVETWIKDKKDYPKNLEFLQWLATDEDEGINPYHLRDKASREKVTLHEFGRAIYHLAQRRGFLSNRLDQTDEQELGKVKEEINTLTNQIGESDCQTLGQYYYKTYLKNQKASKDQIIKIRGRYTHREAHYLHEFNLICDQQKVSDGLRGELRNAIFYQRPLKSQKSQIGRCTLEPDKLRCSVSHPAFEEFRARQFINSIKMEDEEGKFRPLTEEQRELIWPKFTRISKPTFEFKEIIKTLTPKGAIRRFNYKPYETVSACPFMAMLNNLLGEDWAQQLETKYTLKIKKDGTTKSTTEIVHDLWHVLFSFDQKEKVKEFGRDKLGLNTKEQEKLANYRLKREYAQLSLKAIKKVLPFLRDGYLFSYAVFLANIEEVVGAAIWQDEKQHSEIVDSIRQIIDNHKSHIRRVDIINACIGEFRTNGQAAGKDYTPDEDDLELLNQKMEAFVGKQTLANWSTARKDELINELTVLFTRQLQMHPQGQFMKKQRIDERIKAYLYEAYNLSEAQLARLYHPSITEPFGDPERNEKDGKLYLGSPAIDSVRNPMAMRTMHQLRRLVNQLIREDIIDEGCHVHIELARQLNDANQRAAIRRYNEELRREREADRKEIIKCYLEQTGKELEPSTTELLKYKLWKEQDHRCIYTGLQIGVAEFIGADPSYQVEHTIPFSISQDDSQANKTLAHRDYNAKIKGQKLPIACPNYDTEQSIIIEGKAVGCPPIITVLEKWEKTVDDLALQYNRRKRARGMETKEQKDRRLQNKHYYKLKLDYWRNKVYRFKMEEVKPGFKNSQLIDTGIITKYARAYLNTMFDRVVSIKGEVTATFRKHWGLQEEYAQKERVNHIHHCIDAIVVASITKDKYDALAHAVRQSETGNHQQARQEISATKPWKSFVEDIRAIEKETLISHHTPDQMHKQSKKALRKRKRIQRDEHGEVIYTRGDTARGSLHKDTFYGAIKDQEGKVHYVVRRSVTNLSPADIKNIVDPAVRKVIEEAVELKGLKEAQTEGFKMPGGTPIKKVRCFARTVTDPIHLKKHQFTRIDKPRHEHKEQYYVMNDDNYALAVYEGTDDKNVVKRAFEVVNAMQAAQYFKSSNTSQQDYPMVPESVSVGNKEQTLLPLVYLIKKGTLVIFYETAIAELKDIPQHELVNRCYKVAKFDKTGRVHFRAHNEARPASELKETYQVDLQHLSELIRLSVKSVDKFKVAIGGVHFDMTVSGNIMWRF